MARIMRMPPKSELPDGPHRDFVEELRRYYRLAGRPSLREISRAIEGRADLKEVTASQETVRRMLRGMVLPTDWDRVYAVFFVLCEMGNVEPEGWRWEAPDDRERNIECLRRRWDEALEYEELESGSSSPPLPRTAVADPWSSDASSYSDEPPF